MLDFALYRDLIHLATPFSCLAPELTPEGYAPLIDALLQQTTHLDGSAHTRSTHLGPRDLLYTRLISRAPFSLSEDVLEQIDRLLAYELSQKPVTSIADIKNKDIINIYQHAHSLTHIALWQGDIATLRTDAIVNAANNQLLGCFQPFHRCIDNVIHASAGPRLRDDCARIIDTQQALEETGCAKITRGYHLPSRYVLHTVGPIYNSSVGHDFNADLLAKSYKSCMETAAQLPAIQSIAFCCISTGVFGFPNEAAAQVALHAVSRWLQSHPERFTDIIFNVFLDKDVAIYQKETSKRSDYVPRRQD